MRIPKKYKYCKIGILPDPRPNLKINSNGICNACANNNIKKTKISPSKAQTVHNF